MEMTSQQIIEEAIQKLEQLDIAEILTTYSGSIEIPCHITGFFDRIRFDQEDCEWYIILADGIGKFRLSDNYDSCIPWEKFD